MQRRAMFFRPRTKPGSDSNAAVDDLQDVGQRSLIRMIFASTGLTLGVFCALQFVAGNYLFASFELVATATLLWGAWRIVRVRMKSSTWTTAVPTTQPRFWRLYV